MKDSKTPLFGMELIKVMFTFGLNEKVKILYLIISSFSAKFNIIINKFINEN